MLGFAAELTYIPANNFIIEFDILTESSIVTVRYFLIPIQNTPFDFDQGLRFALFR